MLEIEELMFERQFPWAVWPINEFTFIGVNPGGAHVRVYWFEGAPGGLGAQPLSAAPPAPQFPVSSANATRASSSSGAAGGRNVTGTPVARR